MDTGREEKIVSPWNLVQQRCNPVCNVKWWWLLMSFEDVAFLQNQLENVHQALAMVAPWQCHRGCVRKRSDVRFVPQRTLENLIC
jgi:hypothetical protein